MSDTHVKVSLFFSQAYVEHLFFFTHAFSHDASLAMMEKLEDGLKALDLLFIDKLSMGATSVLLHLIAHFGQKVFFIRACVDCWYVRNLQFEAIEEAC